MPHLGCDGGSVSVVVPAFNAVGHLGEALEDGSTDGTGDLVARFGGPVTCHRQPRAGAPAARNHGIRLTRGSHLTFLDADDVWEHTKLERQLQVFDERPGRSAASSWSSSTTARPTRRPSCSTSCREPTTAEVPMQPTFTRRYRAVVQHLAVDRIHSRCADRS